MSFYNSTKKSFSFLTVCGIEPFFWLSPAILPDHLIRSETVFCVSVHQRGQISSVPHRSLPFKCYFHCLPATLTSAGQICFEQLDLWPNCYLQLLGTAPSYTWISRLFLSLHFHLFLMCFFLLWRRDSGIPLSLCQRKVYSKKMETKWANPSHYVQSGTSQPYHSNIKHNCMYSHDNQRVAARRREHESPVSCTKTAPLRCFSFPQLMPTAGLMLPSV